jgi:hypothetical protein
MTQSGFAKATEFADEIHWPWNRSQQADHIPICLRLMGEWDADAWLVARETGQRHDGAALAFWNQFDGPAFSMLSK